MADTPGTAPPRTTESPGAPDRFRLGDWLVVPDEGALRRGTHAEHLEPRAMEVLVRLCRAGGEVVGAEQLLTEVWRGTFYGDNPVHKAVAQIRKALGDAPATPEYIETVRKRGYRVRVPVRIESVQGVFAPAAAPAWSTGSPFRGLRPFEAEQADVFFGRDAMVARSLQALLRQREAGVSLVLVVGRSGSGKTSLLQAGLLPDLVRGRDGLRVDASARMTPARDLVPALADAMSSWTLDGRVLFHPTERALLEHWLAHDTAPLLQRIDASVARMLPTLRDPGVTPCLALVIDPLEALLGDGLDPAQLPRFERTIEALARHPNVIVLAACRVDFYPALVERLPLLASLKGSTGHVDLPLLGTGELALCVRGPARAAGLVFERDPASQECLDDRLIDDAQRSPEMLPMLQHVLDRLFEARHADGSMTFAAYRAFGGLEGAIAHHADAVLEKLDADARGALPDVLANVAELRSDTATVVGRRARWSTIAEQPAERLVAALVDARLFATDAAIDPDADGRTYRVAHEALLRRWPRAVAWAAENREWLHLQERVRTAAQRWEADGRRPDMLWRSWRLAADAGRLRHWPSARLRPGEEDFIAASWRSVRRQRWSVSITAALVLGLGLGSAVLAVREHQARAQAEARRAQAEHLLDFALGDLADKLRPIARLDVLQGVAQQALSALTDPDARFDSPAAVLQRVRALRTSAEVLLEQGDLAGGERALHEAMTLVDAAVDAPGTNRDVLFERSQLAYWQGLVEFRRKQLDLAAGHWQRYADDTAALAALEPSAPEWLLERSYAMNNMGTVDKARGRWPSAIAAFQDSIALKRRYVEQVPDAVAARSDLADSLSWLADTLERAGDPRDALPLMVEQQRLLQASVAAAPDDGLVLHRSALAGLRLGLLLASVGSTDESIALLRESAARLQEIAARDSGNRTWQRDAANARLQLGWALAAVGQYEEGRRLIDTARAALQPLLAIGDPPAEWRRLAAIADLRAFRLNGAARPDDVAAVVASLRALHVATPADRDTRTVLAGAVLAQGDAHAALGDAESAHSLWREAIALVRDAADAESPDRIVVEVLASALARLADPEAARWVAVLSDAGFAHPAFAQDQRFVHTNLNH